MLPKSIYQSLPYFYIGLGLLCLLLVESRLILISSTLLIAAGGFVILMRYRNSVDPVEYIKQGQIKEKNLEDYLEESADFPDHERRIGDEREFPVVDDNGVVIPFDRRNKTGP